jgi:putative tryptophan/tyrosine transport system substrate-binding protein
VIVVGTGVATLAATKATASIPIVQAGGSDPVRSSGVAESLARPSSNVTGLTNQSEDLSGKLLQLLMTIVPSVSHVAVLYAAGARVTEPQLASIQKAAATLQVILHPVAIAQADMLEVAFATLTHENVGGLVVLSAALFATQVSRIVDLAAGARLPAIYPYRYYASAGGLMAYGVNFPNIFRQSARFVDRILKGAQPGDLPIEQPTKFEFAINLQTARTLAIDVPPSLLAIADEVIE